MIAMHPGEYIAEVFIEPLEITGSDLAKKLSVSPSTISRLLNSSMDVTPDMAVRLEYVLGRSAESWLMMQMDFNLLKSRASADLSALTSIA